MEFLSARSCLATASGDEEIRLWDTRDARRLDRDLVHARQRRAEMAPRVDALFAELGGERAVIDALRADDDLDDDACDAALQLVLERCLAETSVISDDR